jgi:hypothetical protein
LKTKEIDEKMLETSVKTSETDEKISEMIGFKEDLGTNARI